MSQWEDIGLLAFCTSQQCLASSWLRSFQNCLVVWKKDCKEKRYSDSTFFFVCFLWKKKVSRMTKKALIFMPQLFFLQDFPANAKPSEIEKWQLSKVNLATKIISKYHVKGQTKRGLRCPWSSLNRAGWWTMVNHPSISGKVVEIDLISQIGAFI